MNVTLQVFGILLSAAAALIGMLVLLYIKTLSRRLDLQENDIAQIKKDFSFCKIDCERNNVSKEDWVRSEAFTRDKLDEAVATLNRIEGQLGIIDKIPQIAGNIAREIASQLKPGG
ncbi:MAG: hypothetical protein MUP16_04955 [Sedimentisphaerales bacterium]|nr:hypothetical protein [Sedimentisphaerales bacterium]